MFRQLSKLLVLAAIGGAIGYVVQQRKQKDKDVWDAEDPDGDWGMAQSDLERTPSR